jgi:hypothetical protein
MMGVQSAYDAQCDVTPAMENRRSCVFMQSWAPSVPKNVEVNDRFRNLAQFSPQLRSQRWLDDRLCRPLTSGPDFPWTSRRELA